MNGGLIGVQVRTTAPAIVAVLRELTLKQVPFATAVALTRVAQDGRAEVVRRMPEHFKVRSQRVLKGVTIEPAKKADWPNPTAKVGLLDQFMAVHVTGGDKRPEKGARHIAVPTRLVVRTGSGKVPARLKPRTLRDRPDVFLEQQKIVQRSARRRGQAKNLGGKGIFFSLVTEAHITASWPMPGEVEKKAGETYGSHFERELTAAVRSARVRGGSFSSDQGRSAYLAKRTELGRIGG